MIAKKPLVSIIITYFDKKKYIKKTFNSIFDQTYKNYELIFVYDDPNKDDLQLIKELLKRFKKKKLILNKKNLGVAKSRNLALRACSGAFVAFIDADDIWKKNKLTNQINFMINKFSDLSFTSYGIIDEKNKLLGVRKVTVDANYKKIYRSNFIGLSTVIINRKKIKKFKFPNLNTQEDFALWLTLLRKGYSLNHLNSVLSYWRKTENSLSSNNLQKITDAFKLYYSIENKNFIFSIYSVLVLSYYKLKNNILN